MESICSAPFYKCVFFFVCSIKLLMSDVVQTAYMVIQDITWFELPISYDEN